MHDLSQIIVTLHFEISCSALGNIVALSGKTTAEELLERLRSQAAQIDQINGNHIGDTQWKMLHHFLDFRIYESWRLSGSACHFQIADGSGQILAPDEIYCTREYITTLEKYFAAQNGPVHLYAVPVVNQGRMVLPACPELPWSSDTIWFKPLYAQHA